MHGRIAVIYDDHQLFADAFSSLIGRMGLFRAVLTFQDEQELNLFLIRNGDQAVYFFVDYYIGNSTSLTLVSYIRTLVKRIKVICVSSCTNPTEIQSLLMHRVDAFINKISDTSVLVNCLETLEKKQAYLCPTTVRLLDQYSTEPAIKFTARELDMLHYFDQGLSIVQTAEKTNLSRHTIVAHRRNMMEKTKTSSINELLAYARKRKVL